MKSQGVLTVLRNKSTKIGRRKFYNFFPSVAFFQKFKDKQREFRSILADLRVGCGASLRRGVVEYHPNSEIFLEK